VSVRARILLALAAALLSAPLAGARPQETEEHRATRLLRIPETRVARDLAERAVEHSDALRWGPAVEALQLLVEEHSAAVLPSRYHRAGDRESVHPAHVGAAEWARARLGRLPAEARELYLTRYEPVAREALARARRDGDRTALVTVAQRWPITEAARSAWWAVGDLELELGHLGDAMHAWRRAAEQSEVLGVELPPGAVRRLELAAAVEAGDAGLGPLLAGSGASTASLRLPGEGESDGPVPLEGASTWSAEITPHPFGNRAEGAKGADRFNLFPVLAGDRVLVSTSLRVQAHDAFTGEQLWVTDEPAGWEDLRSPQRRLDLFAGVDSSGAMVAPATGEGVAVAALQLPFSKDRAEDYQGITIKVPLPERRLFAFALEDGTPLWDHAPEPPWGLGGGTFAEQALVAGPPIVSGTRVLVPCYRVQGRIEYHVACYDLSTGEFQWATEIVSGQRELNMFGRYEREFAAPPLRVEGDRVIALTQLGLVAAVDLFSGRILWEALYDQLPLPEARSYNARQRTSVWRNAPPVVADGLVLSTPTDSRDLVAMDLDDGTVLWTRSRDQLRPLRASDDDVDTLLGADRDSLYLGGDVVCAWTRSGGLSSPGVFQRLWHARLDNARRNMNTRARAVLAREAVIVSEHGSRKVIQRETGHVAREFPLPSSQVGNVVVGEGMLFSLSARRLTAFFDWDVLEARAEALLAAAPDSVDAGLPLIQLLLRRGTAAWESGDTARAAELLARAHDVLLGFHAAADDGRRDPRIAENLHSVLRAEAAVRAGLADVPGALDLLRRARELAPDGLAMRDTLLDHEALVRERDPAEWLATLALLEERCASLSMPENRIEPGPSPVTVALWVLFERAEHARAHGQPEAPRRRADRGQPSRLGTRSLRALRGRGRGAPRGRHGRRGSRARRAPARSDAPLPPLRRRVRRAPRAAPPRARRRRPRARRAVRARLPRELAPAEQRGRAPAPRARASVRRRREPRAGARAPAPARRGRPRRRGRERPDLGGPRRRPRRARAPEPLRGRQLRRERRVRLGHRRRVPAHGRGAARPRSLRGRPRRDAALGGAHGPRPVLRRPRAAALDALARVLLVVGGAVRALPRAPAPQARRAGHAGGARLGHGRDRLGAARRRDARPDDHPPRGRGRRGRRRRPRRRDRDLARDRAGRDRRDRAVGARAAHRPPVARPRRRRGARRVPEHAARAGQAARARPVPRRARVGDHRRGAARPP
jgi:outer membrane protein assembly factor BamB